MLLYTIPRSPTAKELVRAIFEIARRDLAVRGPGEFMGARQSGDALLRFADLAADGPLIEAARAAAQRRAGRWSGGWLRREEFVKT